jgi:hypothetical protein
VADQIISTWDKSPLWGATLTADEINSPDFGFPATVQTRFRKLARDRDAYARRLLEERLPRPLHFLLDRPKALRRVLRIARRWRLTMATVDLRRPSHPLSPPAHMLPPAGVMTVEAARKLSRVWVAEMDAAGKRPDGGLIFTYTDPSGLPAEVYL